MDYNEADVDHMVNELVAAVEQGKCRKATKAERMEVRLAALSALVNKMQDEVHEIAQNEKKLAHV